MALIQDNAVFVTASGINKTLKQAVIDGDLGAGGGGATISDWQPFTAYTPSDIIYDSVTFKIFKSSITHTSTGSFDSDLQAGNWTELSGGGVKGWIQGRLYLFDEIMVWSGNFYICTFTHTSSGMSPNLSYWSVIGGGSGESNTASNIGLSGEGVFAQKSGVDLQFKNIVAGTGITLSSDPQIITISSSAAGGGVEIFNNVIILSSAAATITGLNYFRAPSGLTISSIVVQLWTKGAVVSGNLTIDIKKNNSPAAAGMTSIFSVLPTFNFASAADYSTSTGTISTSGLSGGDWLRLDVTSIPSGWSGRFSIMAYA